MDASIEDLLPWKTAAVIAWLGIFLIAERWRPAAREPRRVDGQPAGGGRRLARNAALWLGNAALAPLLVVPVTLLAAGHRLGWRPDWWSGAGGLALDLLVLDLAIYWWHRANHVVPLLWRFHEIHHLDRFLDVTSAGRFHFGEVALSALARAGVILLLDVPVTSVIVFETALLMAAIFHHSNLALPPGLERGLARVIITPSIHWVHHRARRRDTDSNYGTILSAWDRVFRTRSPTPRTLDMPIGVERRAERDLIGLIARPFRGRRARAAAGDAAG